MVAPNKNQELELSPSFSVKDVVEQHTKESVTMPLLEMEVERSPSDPAATSINEYLDLPSSAMKSSTLGIHKNNNKNNDNKKSVTFSEVAHLREIPTLTQEEKEDMFFNKQDKRDSKLQLRRLVAFYRAGNNNFFFDAPHNTSAGHIIQIPEEEQTKIGLEAHINPQMKIAIRRRMTKLVLQHQEWSRQHPTFFDDQFLSQNCTTVAQSATMLALERAQTVVQELANDNKGSIKNIRVNMSKPSSSSSSLLPSATENDSLDHSSSSSAYSVTIMCSPEPMPDSTTTAPAIEAVVHTAANNNKGMEAPGQSCMVR